jgi:hypothetical protein
MARWSYRTLPREDGWHWQVLCAALVIREGVAATHAGAIAEVVETIQRLLAATPVT